MIKSYLISLYVSMVSPAEVNWTIYPKFIEAAKVAGVSAPLLYSLCNTETHLRNVVSHMDGNSNSYGVCQVKLGTARQFFPKIKAKDLMNIYTNILVAGMYLKYQMVRYKTAKKGISAYNAGKPILSNHKYVNKILKQSNRITRYYGHICLI